MFVINKFLFFLSQRRTGTILAILVIVLFPVLASIRLYPFENQLIAIANDTGDDWTSYANYALDIKRHGLLLPMVPAAYHAPAGFLYSYFLALCFLIFGENTIPVYIIQNLMLGLVVAFIYWTFRDKMRNFTGIMFLGALTLFGLLDTYKYYTFRLLSENLALFSSALFFLCFIKGFEKNILVLQLLSAFSMGVLILNRPASIFFGFLLVFIVIPYYFTKKKTGMVHFLLFISALILTTSFLGIRNYLVWHQWAFLPTQAQSAGYMRIVNPIPASVDLSKIDANFIYTKLHINKEIVAYMEYMLQEPKLFINYYFKKILFCFGFVKFLVPQYRWRPHWMLMWLGYFTYLFLRIKNRTRMQLWEIATHLYILCHYGSLILFGQIENYGFRMLLPGINFVLLFSFLAWDMLRQKQYVKNHT